MASGSSTTGNILGVVGAAIGFVAGGPLGAAQGYAIGSSIGNAIDPPKGPTVSGPRLADKSVQVSTYGVQLPRFYGTIAGSGNITWLEKNQLKETVRKKKQGGKGGGGGTTVKTYTYSATFFLSLGEGPIAGVRRIWCGDKLIYNAGSDDLETIIASNQSAKGFHVYLGTDDQMPDSRYQADVGVDNASAFRGEAYIAFYDFQLADYSNALQAAQFKVEIVKAKTSEPYQLFNREDEYLSTQSGHCFGMSDDSIASVTKWTSTTPSIVEFSQNFTSSRLAGRSIAFSGQISSFAMRAIGSTNTVIIKQDQTVVADSMVFDFGSGLPSSLFQTVLIDDSMYITGAGFFGGTLSLGMGVTPNTSVTNKTDRFIYSICPGPGVLIAITDSHIITLDLVTLAELSYVPFTSSWPITGNGIYISYDDGGMWLLPKGNGIAQQYDINTGEKLREVTGIPLFPSIGSYGTPGHISNGVYVRVGPYTSDKYVEAFNLNSINAQNETLASIISREADLSGLITVTDIDVSQISDAVRGYRVSGGSIRSAIEPLQGAFPFDVIQSGYKIKFIPRGQASVAIASQGDLGAASGGEYAELLTSSREMDSQLPVKTAIKYLDSAREYAISEQYAERLNTGAVNRVDREFPIVLTADEAAGVADVLNFLPWLERNEYSFTLPPTFLSLEPSDIITITVEGTTYELRLTEINYTQDGLIECKARPNTASVYSSNALGSEGVPPSGVVGLGGSTMSVLLDIPVIDETLQNSPGYATAMTGYTDAWSGATLFRSPDLGQTWTDIQGYVGRSVIGYATSTLSANSCALIDSGSVLKVSIINGELDSVTQDQMIAGANFAAYGIDGRWEIIRFQNADMQADGSYHLTSLIRGDKGTEWATGLHALGDLFVFLDDPDNIFIDAPVEILGLPRTYRAVTAGRSIDSAIDQNFTYSGVNLRPLSPVYPVASRNVSSDFSLSVTRRSRLSSSWWITGVSSPVGEAAELYEWDIMSGAAVKRTITTSSPVMTYIAADQVSDFGSVQGSITVRVYQISAIVGRGLSLEITA